MATRTTTGSEKTKAGAKPAKASKSASRTKPVSTAARGTNSFRAGPDERGFFGLFGGRFVAETLMPLILELEKAYEAAKIDPKFARRARRISRSITPAVRARSTTPTG